MAYGWLALLLCSQIIAGIIVVRGLYCRMVKMNVVLLKVGKECLQQWLLEGENCLAKERCR